MLRLSATGRARSRSRGGSHPSFAVDMPPSCDREGAGKTGLWPRPAGGIETVSIVIQSKDWSGLDYQLSGRSQSGSNIAEVSRSALAPRLRTRRRVVYPRAAPRRSRSIGRRNLARWLAPGSGRKCANVGSPNCTSMLSDRRSASCGGVGADSNVSRVGSLLSGNGRSG
jgi:hypothetical protein